MDYFDQLFQQTQQRAFGGMPAVAGGPSPPLRTLDMLPPVDPATEQSRIGQLMEDSLGGLGYIGKVLNKPGRAVRGLLGGDPQELLAALPFSDNLGITNEANQVTGRDLLYRAGMIDSPTPGQNFDWSNDLAGIGAEIATDPLTYLSFGSLTAAGRAAQAAGTAATGLRAGLAAGERGLVGFGLPFKNPAFHLGTTPDALDNLLTAGSWARSGLTLPTRVADAGISAATGGYAPFATAGDAIANVAGAAQRTMGGLLQTKYLGGTSAPWQEFAPDVAAAKKAMEVESTGQAFDLHQKLSRMFGGLDEQGNRIAAPMTPDLAELAQKAIQDKVEGLPEISATIGTKLPAGINPAANSTDAYGVADQILRTANLTDRQQNALINRVMKIETLEQSGNAGKAAAKLDEFNNKVVPNLVGTNMWDYGGTLAKPLPQVSSLSDVMQVGNDLRTNPMISRAEREQAGKIMDDVGTYQLQHSLGQAPTIDPVQDMSNLVTNTLRRPVGEGFAPPASQTLAKARATFNPAQMQQIDDMGGFTDKMYQHILGREGETAARGAGKTMMSDFIQYAYRQSQEIPREAGESLDKYNQRVFNSFQANHSALKQRADYLDVPGGTNQLRDFAKNPEISGVDRTLSDPEVKRYLLQQLTGTKDPAIGSPAYKQVSRLSNWLKNLDPEYAKTGTNIFSVDMTGLAISRLAKADKLALADQAAEQVLKSADLNGNLLLDGVHGTSVPDFFKTANLAFEKDGVVTPMVQRVLDGMPAGSTVKDLKNMHIPTELANDYLGMDRSWQAPAMLQPIIKAADYMSNLFRGLTTRPFPAYWMRNLFSDMYQQARAGALTADEVAKGMPSLQKMNSFLRGSTEDVLPGLTAEQFHRELVQLGEFRPNSATKADIVGSSGEAVYRGFQGPSEATGKTMAGDLYQTMKDRVAELMTKEGAKEGLNPLNMAGANGETDRFVLARAFSDMGDYGNKLTRGSHYLSLRSQGWTPEAARANTLKYQLDYNDLTQFERNVMKRVIPWYTYSRRILPSLIEDMATQPAYLTAPIKAMTGTRPEGQFVPDYIAEGASLPLAGAPDGQQRYITSFGLPFEDESVKAIGNLMHGDVRRTAESVLGQTMPWIKAPLEYAFDKQLYSGRPLSDLKPYEGSDLGGLLSEQQARLLTSLIANSPGSRGVGTVERLIDPRKDPIDQIANLASGVKISDVDYDRAREANTQKMIENLLEGHSGFRRQSDLYVPLANVPDLSQGEGEMYRMYLDSQKRARDLAAAKKKAGVQ